jgi:hypothetical protein
VAAVQVVGTHTLVDVQWQDGSVVRGIPAKTLIPVTHLGDHDFWPEEYVLERLEDRAATPRIGLVRPSVSSPPWVCPPLLTADRTLRVWHVGRQEQPLNEAHTAHTFVSYVHLWVRATIV